MVSPLGGLTILDLSTTLAGAMATQFLADCGATVVLIETPAGHPLRSANAWPALARGKGSTVLDWRTAEGRSELDDLIRRADVLVTSEAPAELEPLRLTAEALGSVNPRLVSASITGGGPDGPLSGLDADDGLVMAKLGYFHLKRLLAARPGPAYVSVPFASWGAAHGAVHGILAALYARESTGVGQQVRSDLVRGVHSLDTWQWFTELVGVRWPDAFQVVEAFNSRGEIQGPLIYPLLCAPTKDGVWLQFAQTEARLFAAFMQELDLMSVFSDPKWAGAPVLPTQELRTELWELMITKVGERTLAEWQAVFESNKDLSAEIFRAGGAALDHPQLVHERRDAIVIDPDLGPVRQPSTLAFADGKPLTELRPAPRLGSSRSELSTDLGAPPSDEAAVGGLPLEGVTVLEFGLMFAAPFGATLLTDLGARVIKIETLAGDTIRRVQQFPESGGAKVLQGKESIALDLATDDGKEIVRRLAAKADIVLQSFRAGAAERAGVDAASLLAINPDLIYVNAPGYGVDGPYGHRPAYAPSIGAASGLAMTDAAHGGAAVDSIEDKKRSAIQLFNGAAVIPIQADGIAAHGVASTMLLGLLARRRNRKLPALTATMLGTAVLANLEQTVSYEGQSPAPRVDSDYLGTGALNRMYATDAGWIFIAAPSSEQWDKLVAALSGLAPLADDARFATAAKRSEHDSDLADLLGKVFATASAAEWERQLADADVRCVEVYEGQPQRLILTDPELSATYTVQTTGPVLDEYPRLDPLTQFSRAATQSNGFCLAGEHTDSILRELGYDEASVADLRARSVVTG